MTRGEQIKRLQRLQIEVSEHVPSYDPEDEDSAVGREDLRNAVALVGTAISKILCIEEP